MKHAIITGGSKGIGEGICLKLINEGYQVHSLARSKSEDFPSENQITCDLLNVTESVQTLANLLAKIKTQSCDEILLVNNAGSLGDVDRIENNSAQTIEKTITLNVSVPLALSGCFINELKDSNINKTIINISSGAAVSPYYGWSSYCSSKAAIDMATKVMAIEQETAKHPVRVLSIYPGIVDTNMQTQIRGRNTEQFAPVEKFIESKEMGWLSTPLDAAKGIFNLYIDESVTNGSIIDVRVE